MGSWLAAVEVVLAAVAAGGADEWMGFIGVLAWQ
jgi:hypothetical protein